MPAEPAAPPPIQASRPPRRSNGCWIFGCGAMLVLLGMLALGAIFLSVFGVKLLASELEARIEGHPAVVERIGTIARIELDFARTALETEADVFVYRIRGDKGNGRLTVRQSTREGGAEEFHSIMLRLSSGETYELIPSPRTIENRP